MCSSLGAFSFLEAPARRGFLLGAVSVFGPPPLDAPNQVPSHRVGQVVITRRPDRYVRRGQSRPVAPQSAGRGAETGFD